MILPCSRLVVWRHLGRHCHSHPPAHTCTQVAAIQTISTLATRAAFTTSASPPPPLPPPPSSSSTRPHHQLNINKGLKKSEECKYFHQLIQQPVTTLQGIGPKHAAALSILGLETIQQLADHKFFHLARSMTTLAELEEGTTSADTSATNGGGGRLEGALMNLDKGVDKQYEHLTFQNMIQQPVHALQGISPSKAEAFHDLGVKTVADLANFKYCQWAEAMVVAARFEQHE